MRIHYIKTTADLYIAGQGEEDFTVTELLETEGGYNAHYSNGDRIFIPTHCVQEVYYQTVTR